MQPKFVVLLAAVFLFGMASTLTFLKAVKNARCENPAEIMVQIYVAKENIEGGSKLKTAQFTPVPWPLSRLPDGAVLNVEQFDGMFIKQNLFANEPLVDCKISSPRSGALGCCIGPLTPREMEQLMQQILKSRCDYSVLPQ